MDFGIFHYMASVWRQPTISDSNDFPASHRSIRRPNRHCLRRPLTSPMFLAAAVQCLFWCNPCNPGPTSHKMSTLCSNTFRAPLLLDCCTVHRQLSMSHNHNHCWIESKSELITNHPHHMYYCYFTLLKRKCPRTIRKTKREKERRSCKKCTYA